MTYIEKGWIHFENERPAIGQEIWIVWPSGHYQPEYRVWDEDMEKMQWDDMRWLPVPNYKPEKMINYYD